MQNFMKTILNAIKTWTKVEIQQSKEETKVEIQQSKEEIKEELNSRIKNSAADWNENDSAADSYVKNRTHWEEVEEAVIIPEITVTIPDDGGYEDLAADCPMLINGQTYIVILNGVRYECVARDYGGGVIIGNGTICGDGKEGNGEPFAIDSYDGGDIYLNVAAAGEYTVSIYNYQRVVHKLDSKYLPEYDGMVFEDDLNPVAYSGDYHDLNNIDTELSETSNNAVSNSIITAGINERLKLSDLNMPFDDIDAVWSSVCYGDGKFVAIIQMCVKPNYSTWAPSNEVAYSTDGINWMESTMPSGYWHSICYGNGKFVAVGEKDKVAYSTDGINWMESTMPYSNIWYSICYGNGKFVAIDRYNRTAYSTDGANWTEGYSFGNFPVCCYGDGKFVAVCSGNGQSYHSTDGVNWERSYTKSNEHWSSICYGNGKFVAISSDSNRAIYSTDGVNWMSSTMPSAMSYICYGDGKFVAIASGSDKAAYSTDGVNWVESAMPSSVRWRSVCYGNGKFVAISSYDKLVAYSIDGITWANKAILKCNEDVAEDVAMVVKPYLKDTIKYHINAPRFTLTMTDEVNGLNYIVAMQNGNLTTRRPTKSIAVTTMPNKTEYFDNDEFDPDGMVVMATDLDGSTREISNYSYNSVINHNDIVSEDGSCKFPITYIEGDNIFKTTVDLNVIYLGDFEYIENNDGTYTLTDWKGTYSGKPSTKIIVPNSELIIV